jgi:hypothetical protein
MDIYYPGINVTFGSIAPNFLENIGTGKRFP